MFHRITWHGSGWRAVARRLLLLVCLAGGLAAVASTGTQAVPCCSRCDEAFETCLASRCPFDPDCFNQCQQMVEPCFRICSAGC